MWTVLVCAQVAVALPVAELGDLEELEHVETGVDLAAEEAVLQVQEEQAGLEIGAAHGRRHLARGRRDRGLNDKGSVIPTQAETHFYVSV